MKSIITLLFTITSFFSAFAQVEDDDAAVPSSSKSFDDASIEAGIYSGLINYPIKTNIPIGSYNYQYSSFQPSIGIKGMYQFEFENNNFFNVGITASTFLFQHFMETKYPYAKNYTYLMEKKQIYESRLWLQYSYAWSKIAFTISVTPLCITNIYKPKLSTNYNPTLGTRVLNHTVYSFIMCPGVKYAISPNLIATAEIQIAYRIRYQHIIQLGINYSIKDIIQ